MPHGRRVCALALIAARRCGATTCCSGWPAKQPRVIATQGIVLRVRQSEERDRAEREASGADEEE